MNINTKLEADASLITNIGIHFNLQGPIVSFSKIGSGHIHQTFQLKSQNDSMLLQRINQNVFPNIEALQTNLRVIESHFRVHKELLDINKMNYLKLREATDKTLFNENTHSWRAFEWIEDSESFDKAPNSDYAFEAALGFGRFIKILSYLPLSSLNSTIPDFHNGKKRWSEFELVLNRAGINRKNTANDLIEFAQKQKNILISITEKLESGLIPIRLTHNDTKLSNVLFHNDLAKVNCVIDLDTVMPGSVLFDFGDMVRTISCPANEDCDNEHEITINESYFEAICKGFASELKSIITKNEKKELLNGAKYMCLLIGLRFLTDYLNMDVYYPTKYENHNLIRARNQFKLVSELVKKENTLIKTINNIF